MPLPPRADSALRDTLARRDSLHPPTVRGDTIQPPLARAEAPPLLDLAAYVWTRDSVFAGGAVTLADLLERVPGATSLRVGWLGAPTAVAYLGDVARVRVFLDGLELDPLDPRDERVLDLTSVPLWPMEEVRVERGATELRVHMRTWRVERTTPYSRADVFTGDQQSNLFRLLFGRRYAHGEALQLGGQQYSARPTRSGASSDELSLLARLGWVRGRWSVDGFALRASSHRGVILPFGIDVTSAADSIPTRDAARADVYVRAAYGDPERGAWAQLLAGGQGYKMESVKAATDATQGKLPDSTAFHAQYLLTGGFTRGTMRVTALDRVRVVEGRTLHSPAVRASASLGPIAGSALAEEQGADSTRRVEAALLVVPFRWLRVSAAAGRLDDRRRAESRVGAYARAEGEVRVRRLWLGGGVLRREAALLETPAMFGPAWRDTAGRVVDPARTGAFLTVRGTIAGPLKAEVMGIQWQDEGPYRPRYQTRSDVYVSTTLPDRFRSGNFGLVASVRHEYRSSALFPRADGTADRTVGYRMLGLLLEIRIVDAVVSYQFRNLLAQNYGQVPGFLMPRQTQYYGVRWSFWN